MLSHLSSLPLSTFALPLPYTCDPEVHRASQRFSRLLEGVSSITSLVSLPGYTREDTPEAPTSVSAPGTPGQHVEEEAGPTSLPYWVEASQNIYKVSI